VLWSVDAIAYDPDNPAVIYVGGDNGGSSGGGLQRTVNGGSTWTPFEQGLPSHDVTGLSALSTNPLTVLASVWHPILRVGGAARALDTPGPVALASTTGTPISVVVSPTPRSTSTPRPHHRAASKGGSISAGLVVAVLVVLVVLALALAIFVRRRRRRLDAEAPP
jgi:hypothetical protein